MLTPELRQRIERLFSEALEIGPGEREAFLDRECAGAHNIRAEVESLLEHHARAHRKPFLNELPARLRPLLDEAVACGALQPELGPDLPHAGDANPQPSSGPEEKAAGERDPDAAPFFPQVGAELVPGYRLVKHLGGGGFGEVWEAVQTGPCGHRVALKFVRQAHAAEAMERRALEVIKDIRHPHLLTPFSTWEIRGHLVIGMELADGTLDDYFCQCRARGLTGIPQEELLGFFQAAAEAIDYLNEPRPVLGGGEGIAIQHRDIKPQNLLRVGNSVKVADFGVARLMKHTETGHTGPMSFAFAAPEFLRGKVHKYSDQYSLAVTYCYLRFGQRPFEGGLDLLHEAEQEVVQQALAENPEERWPSCREFVNALRLAWIGRNPTVPYGDSSVSSPQAIHTPMFGNDGEDVGGSPLLPVPQSRVEQAPPALPCVSPPLPGLQVAARSSGEHPSTPGESAFPLPRRDKGLSRSRKVLIGAALLLLPVAGLALWASFPGIGGHSVPGSDSLQIQLAQAMVLEIGEKKLFKVRVDRNEITRPVFVRFETSLKGLEVPELRIPAYANEAMAEVVVPARQVDHTPDVLIYGPAEATGLVVVPARQAAGDESGTIKAFASCGAAATEATVVVLVKPEVPKAIQVLVRKLGSRDRKDRYEAVRELVSFDAEAKAAVPALAEALKDPSVQKEATEALGAIGPEAKEAVPALIEALKDLSVRKEAAEALGAIGPEAREAVPALIEALRDNIKALRENNEDSDFFSAVVYALGRTGAEGKAAIPALIDLLAGKVVGQQGQGGQTVQVADALPKGKTGPASSIAALITTKLLWDDKSDSHHSSAPLRRRPRKLLTQVRAATATALGRMGQAAKEAIPVLTEALKDDEATVRIDAALALWKVAGQATEAISVLAAALKEPAGTDRAKAAEALSETGPGAKTAASALTEALGDRWESVRAQAAFALWRIERQPQPVVRVLAELLDGADLVTIPLPGSKPEDLEPGKFAFGVRDLAVRTCAEIGPDAREASSALLKESTRLDYHSISAHGISVAYALWRVGQPAQSAVSVLAEALQCPDWRVRRQAALYLREMGPEAKAAVPALVQVLKDDFKGVRTAAADSLTKIDPEEASRQGID
jgi:HEAT repeat protein